MLDLMRKHSKSWITAAIIGCIAMVFIFWGVSSTWNKPAVKRLKVNGETITQEDFDTMAAIMAIRLQMNFGGALSQETLKEYINDQILLRAVVNDRLMQQAANKWGLYANDEALVRLIGRDPLFQDDGRFDMDRYRNILAQFDMTMAGYESHLRRQLAAVMVSNVLAALASVPPQQALEHYRLLNDRIRVEYLFFDAAGFQEGLSASESELNDFYAKNGLRWQHPARIRINWVHLNAGDLLSEVQVDEEEARRFYEESPQRFLTPPKAEISHLLLLLPSASPTPEQLAELEQKARDLLERGRNEDFAKLAREYSQDPESAPQGGQLGWIDPDYPNQAIAEAVFPGGLDSRNHPPAGSTLGPLRDPLGYHLIKITAREPEKQFSFDEVKEAILSELKLNKAHNLAWNIMQTIQDNARVSQDIQLSAETHNLSATLTDWFTLAEPDPALKGLNAALEAAFNGNKGDILDLVENSDDFYLLEIADREEPTQPPLAEVESEVARAWVEARANELALAAARDFLAQVQETGWNQAKDNLLASAAPGRKPAAGLTEPFGRLDESAEGLELGRAIFQLARVGQWADQPLRASDPDKAGWYAVRLNKVQTADEQTFENEKYLWMSRETQDKSLNFIEAWLKEAWEGQENKITGFGG